MGADEIRPCFLSAASSLRAMKKYLLVLAPFALFGGIRLFYKWLGPEGAQWFGQGVRALDIARFSLAMWYLSVIPAGLLLLILVGHDLTAWVTKRARARELRQAGRN